MKFRDLVSGLRGRTRKIAGHKMQLELPVAPVLLMATGAGVAVWWWTQWARGRAESEATDASVNAPGPAADDPS